MPSESGPPALPGDIVQVTTLGRRGALVVVEDARAGRVAGYMPFARTRGYPAEPVPIRLREGEFVRVGTAAVLSPPLAKARATAIETQVESPAAPSAPTSAAPAGDDLPVRWNVELRFNSRGKGPGQVWRGTIETEDPGALMGDAMVEALRDPDHGGALYIAGLTFDEVRS
jgi:hypothetical protein